MVYIIQVCRQLASRIRMQHPDPHNAILVQFSDIMSYALTYDCVCTCVLRYVGEMWMYGHVPKHNVIQFVHTHGYWLCSLQVLKWDGETLSLRILDTIVTDITKVHLADTNQSLSKNLTFFFLYGCETWSLTLSGGNVGWVCSRIACWGRHLVWRGTRWEGSAENYIIRSFMICTAYQMLFRCWRMKDQLDVTCYFISLIMCSKCFGH